MTQKQPILCEIITTLIPLKWNDKNLHLCNYQVEVIMISDEFVRDVWSQHLYNKRFEEIYPNKSIDVISFKRIYFSIYEHGI